MDEEIISVLVPVRGRAAETVACVCSLLERADGDDRVEVILGVDKDDEAHDEVHRLLHGGGRLRLFSWDRPPTLGDKLNRLAGEAKGSIVTFLSNDYVMATEGWPGKIRAAVKSLPNGIGVLHPHDDLHPDHSAFPILTRETMALAGFFAAPWFGIPWFGCDTWWDELGVLTGLKTEIDVEVKHQGERGKSHSLVDIKFWAEFFEDTRPLRCQTATAMINAAFGKGSPQYAKWQAEFAQRQRLAAARVKHLRTPEFVAAWETRSASPPSADYPKVKEYAAEFAGKLKQTFPKRLKVALCVPSGETWRSQTAVSLAALSGFSAMAGIDLVYLNVESSMVAHGRNTLVHLALQDKCDYLLWVDSDMKFPPDALIRLLRRGKDIVGATYNKKIPRSDGSYETLGRLKGERPDRIDGLMEALLLPGGMILVKSEIYRKIGWPAYFETARWPHGLDGFKEMLRCSFGQEPDRETLDSLDGTKLGEWLRTNYILGENGEDGNLWSEDYGFVRKARRHGYSLWCDVELTYELTHLGTKEVTCLRAEAKPALQAVA